MIGDVYKRRVTSEIEETNVKLEMSVDEANRLFLWLNQANGPANGGAQANELLRILDRCIDTALGRKRDG